MNTKMTRYGMDRASAVDYLKKVPIEELVVILREVFSSRQPAPEEAAFCRGRFFLGTAWSELESEQSEAERWGPWEVDVVAYPDPAKWGNEVGPDYGLCQGGKCVSCGVRVRSNVKEGICPICGTKVYMT